MKLLKLFFRFIFSAFLVSLGFYFINLPKGFAQVDPPTLWKYQCIDTMKISRDKARDWANLAGLANHIDWEMKTIKSLGSNCVAIDTPYDAEFIPYLTDWVQGARKYNLHIWFRGNFSGWEQWFNYPKLSSIPDFLNNLQVFIVNNSSLFADGDIFTGAPEAEDGGPFNQVAPDQFDNYKQFLIDEYQTENSAFQTINKHVLTNWFSMNGGLAKRITDKQLPSDIGNIITIDHYVKTSPEMSQYIQYFNQNFGTQVVIGEFGAPIPDINGSMTESEQAIFVDSLLHEIYANRNAVYALNYWDLYDGSTALINPDLSERKVTQVIRKYFFPENISGTVTNSLGDKLAGISVKTSDGLNSVKTDANGKYQLLIPQNSTQVIAGSDSYNLSSKSVSAASGNITLDFSLTPVKKSLIYKLEEYWKILTKG